MANFPTTPETGSYFETSGSTYVAMGNGIWRVAAPDADVRMNVIQDDHTKLLLKFDGPNNSTNVGFTGSSRQKRVCTLAGDTKLTSSYSVFGTSSVFFDNPTTTKTDYLSIPNSEDFQFGSDPFTIEAWVYLKATDASNGTMEIFNQSYSNSSDAGSIGAMHWSVRALTSPTWALEFQLYTPGLSSTYTNVPDTVSFPLNSWQHVAVTRIGNDFKLFRNGELRNTVAFQSTGTDDIPRYGGDLFISKRAYSALYGYWNGYIDQMRVTKGIARYSGSFVPNSGSDAFDFLPQPARPADETDNLQTLTLQSSSISAPDAEPTDIKFYVDKPAIDSYTSLLLHFDGGDETTSGAGFVDSSPTGHTVTVVGAKIDNGASVFGTSSVYFGDDYLTIDSHSDFDFGTGDFTIEMWATWDSLANKEVAAIGIWNALGVEWIWISTNRFKFYIASATVIDGATNSFKPALNTWYHLAATRSGTNVSIFVDGTLISSGTNAGNISSAGGLGKVFIGNENSLASQWDGYMDEVRISKGIARYSGNFDPPKKQFGKPDLKLKDSSGTYTIKLKQIN